MSENTQVQQDGESQGQVAQGENQENQTTESTTQWSAEQLANRLKVVNAEARENRKRFQEEKRKREEAEKRALAENGQYKELAEVWQRKAEEAEQLAVKMKDAFAFKSVADTVTLEAQKLGCVDPEALVNLINLKELPLDDSFNVDRNHVKAVLEDMRKQKPYFFQRQAPKVADAIPAKPQTPELDLSKLSLHEKAALLSQLKKQGK